MKILTIQKLKDVEPTTNQLLISTKLVGKGEDEEERYRSIMGILI